MKDYFRKLGERVQDFFKGGKVLENRPAIKKKQWINLSLIFVTGFTALVVLLIIIGKGNQQSQKTVDNKEDIVAENQKIELATDATGGDTKWLNFLEELIETEGKTRTEQIELLKNTLIKQQQEEKSSSEEVLKKLNSRLSYALREIDQLKLERENMKNEIAS